MFEKHVADLLSAFHEGLLSAQASARVAEHLRRCESCQSASEEIRLGFSWSRFLPAATPPTSMWNEISAQLETTRETREEFVVPPRIGHAPWWSTVARRSLLLPATLLILVAIVSFFYLQTRRSGSDSPVDLDLYLSAIEHASPGQTAGAIANAPPHFAPADKMRAFSVARLDHIPESAPLPGYRLVAHRISNVEGAEAVQLVYGKEGDAFAVFVAPDSTDYFFGGRQVPGTGLPSTGWRHVESSQLSAVWFGAGGAHCVLVTRSANTAAIGQIVDYFVSAHKTAG